MKKIAYLISILVTIVVMSFGSVIAETAKSAIQYEYENVTAGTGSSYKWINNAMCKCATSDDKTCKITVTYDDNSTEILDRIIGGFEIKVSLGDIQFENTNNHEIGFSNSAGFEFLQGSKLRIIESYSFPFLNGLLINIDGYIVDQNNVLTVYIPSGGY